MPELIILGSAASVPDAFHDNTYMVLRGEKFSTLIDCAGSPVHKLQRVGIPLESLEALVITHYHPDHIYGLPALILSLWMYGRRELKVFGLAESLRVVLAVMDVFTWKEWPSPFKLSLHELLLKRRKKVLEAEDFKIIASPVKHVVPNIALKFISKKSGRSIVYSSDTEPCESLYRLAKGADVLIHESSGPLPGHSTSQQAGAMARRCGVKRLVLIHFPPLEDLEGLLRAAQEEFSGPVELASDFSIHHF